MVRDVIVLYGVLGFAAVCQALAAILAMRPGFVALFQARNPQGRRTAVARSVEVPEYEVHEEVGVDPAHTALIVVDMQNDFVAQGAPM